MTPLGSPATALLIHICANIHVNIHVLWTCPGGSDQTQKNGQMDKATPRRGTRMRSAWLLLGNRNWKGKACSPGDKVPAESKAVGEKGGLFMGFQMLELIAKEEPSSPLEEQLVLNIKHTGPAEAVFLRPYLR